MSPAVAPAGIGSGPEFWLVLAGLLFAERLLIDRTERGRAMARRFYVSRAYPYVLRMAPATGPLVGLALLVVAAGSAAPSGLGGIVGSAGMGLVAAAAAAGYRRPPLGAPRWMRDEIRNGRLPLEGPDAVDRLTLWLLVALAVLAPLSGIALTIAGQAR